MQKEKVVFVPVEASTPPNDPDSYHVTIFEKEGDGYEYPAIVCFTMGMWEVEQENQEVKEWLQPLPDKYILSEDELRKVKEDAWDAAIRSAQYEINPLPGTLIPPHKQEYLSSLK